MKRTADEQIFCAVLKQKPSSFRTGIFLSFWIHIPRAASRTEQVAHIAVHHSTEGFVGTMIPINFLPTPGSNPPQCSDIILPHAIALFLERKLARLGITKLQGATSVRNVQPGNRLCRQYH
jgi:hypothetical protein